MGLFDSITSAVSQVLGNAPGLAETNSSDSTDLVTGLKGYNGPAAETVRISKLISNPNTGFFINWPKFQASDLMNFNQVYPYQMVITKLDNGGNQKPLCVLNFPIAPSSISMSIPAAVSLTVTQAGINEESNGAPLQPITLGGSTGVLNTQTTQASDSVLVGTLQHLFSNTISAVNNTIGQVNNLASVVTGTPAYPINLNTSNNNALLYKTGFYAFHNMVRFFNYYVALKKSTGGQQYRLGINMYKDKMYYFTTFNGMDWQKKEGSLEYFYTIRLTAWKQSADPIGKLSIPKATQLNTGGNQSNDLFGRLLNAISLARKTISSAVGILRGISADANQVVEIYREMGLLLKTAIGAANTVADFPNAFISGIKSDFIAAQQNVQQFNPALMSSTNSTLSQSGLYGGSAGTLPGQNTSPLNNLSQVYASNNLGNSATQPVTASPLEQIFNDPTAHFDIFDNYTVASIPLSQSATKAANDEIARVQSLNDQDFITRKQTVTMFSNAYAEARGAASTTYNRAQGLPPPNNNPNTLTLDDIQTLSALNELIITLDQLIVVLQQQQAAPDNDYYNYYVDYAINGGLALQKSTSKFFIPFPNGASLELLAAQYLGDLNRWPEIAAANGLKEPYIDEVGYTIPFASNGSLNTIPVANPAKLYIGQVVYVSSNTQVPAQFQITQIDIIDQSHTLLIFGPGDDFSTYDASNGAKILAYLPDTINSTKLIAIPTNSPPSNAPKIKIGPDVSQLSGLAALAQTDFLLNSLGDLVMTQGGNIQRSAGYTNLVQASRMKLLTNQGSMLNNLTFGNPLRTGISVADINISDVLKTLDNMFTQDSRFTGVLGGSVSIQGPAAPLDLLIGIAGTNVVLPMSTAVPAQT